MKVLYLVPHLHKGGAEVVICELANGIAGLEGNNVTLLTFIRSIGDEYNVGTLSNRVKLRSLIELNAEFGSLKERALNKILYLFSPFIAFYLFKKYKLRDFDIIHISMTLPSFYCVYFRIFSYISKASTKYVETFHTNWRLLKLFNKVIFAVSWSIVDCVVWEIGSNEERNIRKYSFPSDVRYIPLAVKMPGPVDDAYVKRFSQRHALVAGNINMFTISRLRFFEKRIDIMIKLLKELHARGFKKHTLTIVGDGPDYKEAVQLSEKLAIEDFVKFTGYADDPNSLLELCDVYLVAMYESETGISGLQAGIKGIPCIGIQTQSDYKCKDDLVFSSSDPSILADYIIENYDKFESYGNRFRDYIRRQRTQVGFISRYLQLYESLLK